MPVDRPRREDHRCRARGRHGRGCRARRRPNRARVEQLLAESGEVSTRTLVSPPAPSRCDQQRASPAPVLRIGGIASAPMIADARNPAGRAAAENGDLQTHAALCGTFSDGRGTFLNRLKKFSVVSTRHLRLAHAAQGREQRRGVRDEGRLVGLAAHRLGRKIMAHRSRPATGPTARQARCRAAPRHS